MNKNIPIEQYYNKLIDSTKPKEIHKIAVELFTEHPDQLNNPITKKLVALKYKNANVSMDHRRELFVKILSSGTELHVFETLMDFKKLMFGQENYKIDLITFARDFVEIYSNAKLISALQYVLLFRKNINSKVRSTELEYVISTTKNMEQAEHFAEFLRKTVSFLDIHKKLKHINLNDIINHLQ